MKRIGFFDSGIGGISVLRDAVRLMPEENYIYYGDSANAPYGIKSKKEILDLTMNGVNYLLSQDVKALVIACNTATSIAIDQIRAKLSIPVISMEPAIKPALEGVAGKVLVLATPATLQQDRYLKLAQSLDKTGRIINCPCDELAGMIEKNIYKDKEIIKQYLSEKLLPYKNNVDAVVLGCTHYVFVKDIIGNIMTESKIFDGNSGTINHLKKVLIDGDIKEPEGNRGTVILNTSSDDQFSLKSYSWLLNYQTK